MILLPILFQYLLGNVFIVNVSRKSLGKTNAMENFVISAVRNFEKKIKSKVLLDDFTMAGILKALDTSKGIGFWAADELRSTMERMVAGNLDDLQPMRGILNRLYSGSGVDKKLGSGINIELQATCMSIYGLVQEQPLCECLYIFVVYI